MRRYVPIMLGLAICVMPGCQNPNEKYEARQAEPFVPLEAMEAAEREAPPEYVAEQRAPEPAPEPVYTVPPQPAPRERVTVDTSHDEVLRPTEHVNVARTHVVRKGDSLYGLAREYYGDQSRWRDIYEANRGRLSNPDKLSIGMKLIVP